MATRSRQPRQHARLSLQGSQSTTGGTTRSDGCRRHLQPPRPSGSSRGQLNFPGAPYYWGWGAAAPAAATAAGNLRPRPARPQPAAAELRQPDPLVPPPRTQPPQRERQVTVAPQGSGSRPGGRRGGLKTRVGPRRGPQAGTSPPRRPLGEPSRRGAPQLPGERCLLALLGPPYFFRLIKDEEETYRAHSPPLPD